MFRGTLGRTLGNMGCVARMLGQPEYAWECLREALQIGEETGGLDSLTRLLYFDRLLMFGHIVAKCCLANKATNTSSGFNPRWSRSWTQRSNA